MRKGLLSLLALAFAAPAIAMIWDSQRASLAPNFAAFADPVGLLAGCSDIPEAVALADELDKRAQRIQRYMETIEERKSEIAEADEELRKKLAELKTLKTRLRSGRDDQTVALRADIDRLVALYNQMKPAEAAAILTNLPSDFAAEILLRVEPEAGARIIASLEPRQAAILTAEIGARSVRNE